MAKILKITACVDCVACVDSNEIGQYYCHASSFAEYVGDGQDIPEWCPLPDDRSSEYQDLREAVQALIDLNAEARKQSGSWKPLQVDFNAEREVWTRIHRAMEVE